MSVIRGRRGKGHVQRPAGFANDYEKAEQAKNLPIVEHRPEHVQVEDKAKAFRTAGGAGHTVRRPHLDALLASGYATAMEELRRLQLSSQTRPLDADEMRRYVSLVDSVAKLSRTELSAYPDDEKEMTKEELLAAAEEARRFLEEQGD